MTKRTEVSDTPTIYCLKEMRRVPIWYCLGSITQSREPCPHLLNATVQGEKAKVQCGFK